MHRRGPALAVAVGVAAVTILPGLGASHALTAAACCGLGLATLLLGGPSLESWRLTGYLRIAPPLQQLQAQQLREQQARRKRVTNA